MDSVSNLKVCGSEASGVEDEQLSELESNLGVSNRKSGYQPKFIRGVKTTG